MVKEKPSKKNKKPSSKVLSQQKLRRRKWITFLRMCRYGVNNFTRNAWLTLAATAIMTITLLVIFTGVVAHQLLNDTVVQLRDKVNMAVYLETSASEEDAKKVVDEVSKLPSVLEASAKSPSQARTEFIDDNAENSDALAAIKEATNKFPWTISIKVQNINETQELSQFVESNEVYKEFADKNRSPSFAGDRRNAIESIGNAAKFAQTAGLVAGLVFVTISMLIIFNTIRMAIFNRQDEIQMMKLIGAERSFIRGPFVVEAVVYGFFAAILATGIGYGLMSFLGPSLKAAEINVGPTQNLITVYAAFVFLGMILIGSTIGLVSSLLATRKYLKEWS